MTTYHQNWEIADHTPSLPKKVKPSAESPTKYVTPVQRRKEASPAVTDNMVRMESGAEYNQHPYDIVNLRFIDFYRRIN